ncbi:hypothetical protein X777_11004 [Ooceraea biroi]|uniref:Uncharacterized protein n=1 Tax=Ooceraea biroi TaxID=2015173 RepID=A0A026W3S8_OOCBI|nr:hypothetical protein X777_11004 [Ooceraea biroi]
MVARRTSSKTRRCWRSWLAVPPVAADSPAATIARSKSAGPESSGFASSPVNETNIELYHISYISQRFRFA